jgi:hypothetical protein
MACDCADKQQEAHRRLDEKSGQALLHSFAVADEVKNTPADPNPAIQSGCMLVSTSAWYTPA